MTDSMAAASGWRLLLTRRMALCVMTGFSSGLPLFVLINLVPAWLRSEGVSLKDIGLFALIGIPYNWKFLWSPLMDRYALPFLGRRRGWMLLTQIALLLSILAFGYLSPATSVWSVAYLAAAVAFFSASQDIVIDAYRREILPDEELGLGNSVHVNAYRVAGLVPGSLALILAEHLPWSSVFAVVAAFMGIGVFLSLWAPEPKPLASPPKTLASAIVDPLREFFSRHGLGTALAIVAFMFLFKLGDNMAVALATPFYLDMGFTKGEIGVVAKHAGLWPWVIGGMLGGIWMVRLGINRALWLFGAAQWFSVLGMVLLASSGPQIWLLALAIGLEYLGMGLGGAALVAFQARIAHPQHLATQLALFTALTGLPRTFANAITGYLVEGPGKTPDAFGQFLLDFGFPVDGLGWVNFFWLCFWIGIPGMLLLFRVAPWNGEHKLVK
ncbi:MAG: AmpG family muropeptide MFS transporter [Gammaproteobacteria bacterium]|nr:AmpG family muropeptide MFS transporter [Gammaproteobacteria bacterium]